ncbi:glycosyltransferase family 4 protein [Nostoc sp. FACHB-152]|uniref:rhamnosyltransferase WsaF family glycosyltransferase n=1 Tax=unclassified Nostoc TaxID=2593658 RepID=UPI00168879AE|nr:MULTISPECIES: glycosyltransferase [unclassified Nostoc]MBD2445883.1 glycosyltransferase family 4 protein [Nostoc sp. FACHB-152]MBD2467941.1 glycosyltransferase family 4 protein [Nostoc sp. FACHB-145]
MISKQRFLLIAFRKFLTKINQIGLQATISLIIKKLSPIVEMPPEIVVAESQPVSIEAIQNNLSDTHQIILEGLKHRSNSILLNNRAFNNKSVDIHNLSFTWLVPFFSKGSGGHKNLFRFVKGLENLGCKCTIYIVKEFEIGLTPEEIKEKICDYFENIDAEVKIYKPGAEYEKADVLVCTSWITAYAGLTFDANLKVYFVQDYEPLFFSAGSYWYLAENTYYFNYYHITLGPWLTHLLRQKYGVKADYYDIVVDKDLYIPQTTISNEKIKSICNNKSFKVCFYGRSVTPRRCFELVLMALYLFSKKATDITIIAYGWNELPPVPFKCYNLGMLTTNELSELYSLCDVCIAPSASNLSLVAREVMACGCVLMDLDVENTSYDLLHLENSYLVKQDPQSMCDGLMHLYNDRNLLSNLKNSSLKYISKLNNWNYQVNSLYSLIKQQLQNNAS